jgi:hypothetical protein
MAKYRCPYCGANHKEAVHQCRLCGAVIDGTVEMRGAVAVAARPVQTKKRGMGRLALIGILAVVGLLIAAIALGFTNGDLRFGKIRDRIPFLRTHDDGWVKVDDAEGGFTVEMPSSRETWSTPFALADNSRLAGWKATVGPEITLAVVYGTMTPAAGTTSQATLNQVVDTMVAEDVANAQPNRTVTVNKRTETNFRGYPAVVFDESGTDQNGQYAYAKNLVFLKGNELYVIAENTIYKDFAQYDRMTNTFQFTA